MLFELQKTRRFLQLFKWNRWIMGRKLLVFYFPLFVLPSGSAQPLDEEVKNLVEDSIEKVYIKPEFLITKGSIVAVEVELSVPVELYDNGGISIEAFVMHWSHFEASKNKYARPFKVLEYNTQDNVFVIKLQYSQKSNTVDELKLLCQDIIDNLNLEDIHMYRWVTKLL